MSKSPIRRKARRFVVLLAGLLASLVAVCAAAPSAFAMRLVPPDEAGSAPAMAQHPGPPGWEIALIRDRRSPAGQPVDCRRPAWAGHLPVAEGNELATVLETPRLDDRPKDSPPLLPSASAPVCRSRPSILIDSGRPGWCMAWKLFTSLTPDEQRRVISQTRRRRFRRGEIVFHEGDPGNSLHLIAKGHVAVRRSTPLGDIATLVVLGPGDYFGELTLVSPESGRNATVVALDSTGNAQSSPGPTPDPEGPMPHRRPLPP